MSGINFGSPPDPDEIEITVIGPGYGECICIHVGSGRWVVIDSCLDGAGRPWPLTYLDGVGVDFKAQVDMLVATHWHDDHTGGLADCLAASGNATFVLPSVLTRREFMDFVARYNESPTAKVGARVSEFNKVLDTIIGRRDAGSASAVEIRANQGRTLRVWSGGSLDHNSHCVLTAFSPSLLAESNFLDRIISSMPNTKLTKGCAPDLGKNDTSVVVWMSVGDRNFLFGADLEEHGNPHTGWSAILAATNCPLGKASLFKIPHHGSLTGDHPAFWTARIEENATSVVTPWQIADGLLPTSRDIRRLKARSSNVYQTAPPKNKASKVSPKAVKSILDEMGAKPVSLFGEFGAVRLRFKPNVPNDDRIELFGAAKKV